MYEVTVLRDWVVLPTALRLILPVASAWLKLASEDAAYKGIEKELALAEMCLDSVRKAGDKAGPGLAKDDGPDVATGQARAERGVALRQLRVWLKDKAPSFGGLVRVQNKRHEFLWVHPQFESDY